jgi:hypothetical protein
MPAVPEAAAVLQRFDLSDSVELVVRALEERLIDRQGINTPQLTLLQLHRVRSVALAENEKWRRAREGVDLLRDRKLNL